MQTDTPKDLEELEDSLVNPADVVRDVANDGEHGLSFRPETFHCKADWFVYQRQIPSELIQGSIVLQGDEFTGQATRLRVMDVGPECERVKVGDFILIGPDARSAPIDYYNRDLFIMNESYVVATIDYMSEVRSQAVDAQRLANTPSDLHV